ncbi:hypothetical protein CRE_07583 [Caenorhabditis remanei]|uniref:Uncharacterized protein n=1 Tax=Caenorhabditis remanei TaxID=31234 RepID=E3MP49_CAERE|nr:hypothetical protein CRE_07583 [Caenorhabditis remanei]
MARLVAVLLLLALLHPVLSMQCYRVDEFQKTVVDGVSVCMAQFDPQDGTSSFSGLQKSPKHFKHQADGCILTTQKSQTGEVFPLWECICSTELCNIPISWKQFKSSGYTMP